MTEPAPRGASPELRTALFYLTLFMGGGAGAVYSGIWFAGQGLSPAQIGIVNAVPLLLMVVLNLVVGRIADRAADWRQTIVAGAVLAAVLPFGLYVFGGFWGILVFWTLPAIAQMAIVPVIDAAAMRLCTRRGTDFGAMRAWGTVGYLFVLAGTGYLMTSAGPAAFLPLWIGLAVLRGAAALGLPQFRAAPGASPEPQGARRLGQVMRPWFVLPLAGWATIFATHLILNSFAGLLWQRQGLGVEITGLLIALGALSETLVFFAFRRFADRFRARTLILLSAVTTTLRWVAMTFEPGLALLVPLQALHGITYALGFLACVRFIARWTSEDIAAEAQSFFVMLHQIMSMVALYGFGALMQHWGSGAYWGSAAFSGLGAVAIWLSWRLPPPSRAIGA